MNKVKTSLIRKLLHTRSISRAARALEKTANADIADLFGSLSPGEFTALVEVLIHAGRAGRVMTEIPEDYLPAILEKLTEEQLVRVLSMMPADDGVYLILPNSASLSSEERERLQQLGLYKLNV